MANNTATTSDTALATVSGNGLQQNTMQSYGKLNLPQNMAELEMIQDLMQAEAEVEALAIRQVNSKELVNVPFSITDALFTTIKDNGVDKICVNFLLKLETGETISCVKSSNKFNDVYVNFFNKFRGIAQRQLDGYTFETDERWKIAGNPAIVLRKVTAQPKQINKR